MQNKYENKNLLMNTKCDKNRLALPGVLFLPEKKET